jgi:hypothetical protein
MRDFKKLTAVFGGLVASGALISAALMACSDDTLVAASGDGAVPIPDGSLPDTTPPDMGDAGTDAPIDAPSLFEYPPAMGQAICARILTCCSGGAGNDAGVFDGGSFDNAACLKLYSDTGWENSLVGTEIPGVVDGGHLVYNKAQANDCLTRLNNGGPADGGGGKFTCGVVGSTEFAAITAACFAAVTGNIAIGTAGCRSSIECVPGSYCAVPDGGTTGTCTALKAVGANCDDSAPLFAHSANDECSYRGSGSACIPTDGGAPRKCVALRAAGEVCITGNEECQSGLCGDDGNCGTNLTLLSPSTCAIFVDGGQ